MIEEEYKEFVKLMNEVEGYKESDRKLYKSLVKGFL